MDIPRVYRWDPVKARSNFDKHGVAFDFAQRVFDDPRVHLVPTIRVADGEDRHKAIGLVDGKLYTAIFSLVEGTCRLISARRTNSKEDQSYARRDL